MSFSDRRNWGAEANISVTPTSGVFIHVARGGRQYANKNTTTDHCYMIWYVFIPRYSIGRHASFESTWFDIVTHRNLKCYCTLLVQKMHQHIYFPFPRVMFYRGSLRPSAYLKFSITSSFISIIITITIINLTTSTTACLI